VDRLPAGTEVLKMIRIFGRFRIKMGLLLFIVNSFVVIFFIDRRKGYCL
jgi:hypothetical protein